MVSFIDQFKEYSAPKIIDPTIAHHVETLAHSDLGEDLLDFSKKSFVPILHLNLPKTIGGLYDPGHPSYKQAIFIAQHSDAFNLSHELRHAEQHNTIPREILYPDNPTEFLLVQRMLEADAHALQTLATLQLVAKFGRNSDLTKSLKNGKKSSNKYVFPLLDQAEDIANDPSSLKNTARLVFDQYMQDRHEFGGYEYESAIRIRYNTASRTKNFVTNSFMLSVCGVTSAIHSPIVGILALMLLVPLMKQPKASFSRSKPTIANIEKTMEWFGQMPNGQGNYITETDGVSAKALLEDIKFSLYVEKELEKATKTAQKREHSKPLFNQTRDL